MASWWQDLRYAFRQLRLSPGFTAVAILTLALGIGANTAIFQLIDAVRLRTIPVAHPEQLASVRIADRSWASGSFWSSYSELSYPLWQQIRSQTQGFSSLAVWGEDNFNLASGGEMRNARTIWVSGDFFTVLELQPRLGRLLSAADDQPGCSSPAVNISYAFWQRDYAGDPAVIGRQLTLDGHPFEIAGVTPPGFTGVVVGNSFDVAVPVCADSILHPEAKRLQKSATWWLASIGRLKPGWSTEKISAQLAATSLPMLQQTIPSVYDADAVKHYLAYKFAAYPAGTGFSSLREDSATSLWLLLGISGLVLLIACANLANLMLARASARERQLAIRIALGATRYRVIRQLLCESILLSVAGALSGIFFAFGLSRFLVTFISTAEDPVLLDLSMDWRILAFAAGLAILTTVLFGLLPAVRSGFSAPNALLQSGARGSSGAREGVSLRRILVSSQVALSLVLLVGALLFVRSLRNLVTLDAGFQQNGILVSEVDFSRLNIPESGRHEFNRRLLGQLRAIPGVDAVAGAWLVPLGGSSSNRSMLSEKSDEKLDSVWIDAVSPGYFSALRTPLLAGRDFDDHDSVGSAKIAIVNQAFVKKYLATSQNPLGHSFRLSADAGTPVPSFQIVGVVADTKYRDLHEDFLPIAYFPSSQLEHPSTSFHFILRSTLPVSAVINSVKAVLASVNPSLDVDFTVFKTQIGNSILQDKLMATLSGFFGFLAALLAAVGLYGVISYMVVQRNREIGIRMAVGAERSHVIAMIMREAALLTVVGLVLGSGLALASAQAARSLLFGLKPRDPLTFALAILTLSAVAALAGFLPAFRASRVDPLVALREE